MESQEIPSREVIAQLPGALGQGLYLIFVKNMLERPPTWKALCSPFFLSILLIL